ncbi:DNA oxidative demethylase AlkB [Asticcacaulis biprosthecium]|uniref:DNA oxidative demethylase AlkB n=1 Tax=Asticcacaulis biprosthecium TaxID=76891 RepID=UPI00058DC901|nr:DNA oxidative demethylase AlkB [Asticcacaulis biprosthecium]
MQDDLFGVAYPPGLAVLRGFALAQAGELLEMIGQVSAVAPFRNMVTPGGHAMSAAMTNVGLGWVTDRKGYRYTAEDPQTGVTWPDLPEALVGLGERAAEASGFTGFRPDGCLINRYSVGAKMGLHQDINEGDMTAPIVSVSLGLPAVFLFGGLNRGDSTMKIVVEHGDVVVWGGPARLYYHGVMPVKVGQHPLTGGVRYNLTLRKAV